jgi:hypothetical protein
MDLALFDQDVRNRSATSGGFTSSRPCTLVAFTNTAESSEEVNLSRSLCRTEAVAHSLEDTESLRTFSQSWKISGVSSSHCSVSRSAVENE